MRKQSFLLALACLAIFLGSFLASGSPLTFLNLTALAVVASGTLGASLLSSGGERVRAAVAAVRAAYQPRKSQNRAIILEALHQALRSKKRGFYRYDKTLGLAEIPELEEALSLLEAGYPREDYLAILNGSIRREAKTHAANIRVLKAMAAYAPSFGVAGSVIGLIGLLMGLSDTALILKNIPIALISTLYGVVFSTFLLLPAAETLRRRAEALLAERELILEAAMALAGTSPAHALRDRLNALVEPEDRVSDPATLRELKRAVLHGEHALTNEPNDDLPQAYAMESPRTAKVSRTGDEEPYAQVG